MRIIYDHKKLFLFFFFTALLTGEQCSGQEEDSSQKKAGYSLYLYAGGGISRYTASLEPPIAGVTNKQLVKPIGCLRIMWQTDHRLGLGLESGWVTWYSYESKHDSVAATIQLTSIPLLVT